MMVKKYTLGGVIETVIGEKSNRGRRLDHIWLSPNFKKYYHDHEIFSDARDFEKPSDHVPVLVELKI